MLRITVPEQELYDERTEEFLYFKGGTLLLEHSLLSISKWEAIWKKPYINTKKTAEEALDYVRCMTINSNVNPLIYRCLTKENVKEINEYVDDVKTATTFNDSGGPQREVVTSEIIYYWMIAQNVPIEFEKWHFSRLITLLKVCAIKNNPNKKKMSASEIAARNRELNRARRKKYNTKG